MELALKLRHAATWKWAISEKCCRMTDGSASVIANVNKHQMAWEYLCACPIQSTIQKGNPRKSTVFTFNLMPEHFGKFRRCDVGLQLS